MTDFARLEKHNGVQALCFIEARDGDDGSYGPCVIGMCDVGFTLTVTEGPWEDSEAGWQAANEALMGKDLAAFVEACQAFVEDYVNE